MDSEMKFWALIWSFVLMGIGTLILCITIGGMQANTLYYRAQTECIEKGAMWIPMRNSENICLPSKN